jgi:hypothetical protein
LIAHVLTLQANEDYEIVQSFIKDEEIYPVKDEKDDIENDS